MNTLIAQLRYQSDEGRRKKLLEEILKELNEKSSEIKRRAIRLAETFGTRPEFISPEELANRIANIASDFRKLKQIIHHGFNPHAQGHIGKSNSDRYNGELADLKQETQDLANKLSLDARWDVEKPLEIETTEWLVAYSPLILLLIEAIYEASAFKLFVGAFLMCLIVAGGFGYVKFLILKFATKKLLEWPDRVRRLSLIAIVLGSASGVFLGLGYLRSLYLEKLGTQIPHGMLWFMLVSLFIFCGAWVGEYFAHKKREELEERKAKMNQYQDFQDKKDKLENLKQEYKTRKSERDSQLQASILNMDAADTFFKQLNDEYKSTITGFKAVYLQFRSTRDNGFVPDYFRNLSVPDIIDPEDWSILAQQRQNGHSENTNERIHHDN